MNERMKIEKADLILFMGQSNMAGRGRAEEAPAVPEGTGYEFRAVTAPDRLFPLTEPFGRDENDPEGVYEPGMKTGSLVSAFVNAYVAETHVPVVGISCAKGGSAIAEAWCQGCTDGDLRTDPEVYRQRTSAMMRGLQEACKIEKCFLIEIGNFRDDPERYLPIRQAQEKLAAEEPDVLLVSRQFASFAARGLMKDAFHYLQEGYNLVGAEAGRNAGRYIAVGEVPEV